MPIFISYSHEDKAFVNKLAANLVKHDAHVWVDSWELNVGDSILNRVQDAIQESSALLIVLSKASVASAWCNKELNAGLMRELDEKRVIVLPVLIENCDIPPFLREKMYADFRTDFGIGLKALLEAVARVTSLDQGRLKTNDTQIEWSETWGSMDGLFHVEYTLIESSPKWPFTLLTQIAISCNEAATKRYQQLSEHGFDWFGRGAILETICEFAEQTKLDILLTNQHPKVRPVLIKDPKRNMAYSLMIQCRRVGEDNGKDQLVHVGNYFGQIRTQIRARTRKLTREELEQLLFLVADFR